MAVMFNKDLIKLLMRSLKFNNLLLRKNQIKNLPKKYRNRNVAEFIINYYYFYIFIKL